MQVDSKCNNCKKITYFYVKCKFEICKDEYLKAFYNSQNLV